MKSLWATFTALRLIWKIVIIGTLIGAILLLAGGVQSCRDSIHDAAFDAGQKQEEEVRKKLAEENVQLAAQNQQLAAERNQLIGQAQALEDRAEKAEAEAGKLRKSQKAARKRVRLTDQQLTAETARYNEALKALETDTSGQCAQWLRNCERAKDLGIKPKGEPCKCN